MNSVSPGTPGNWRFASPERPARCVPFRIIGARLEYDQLVLREAPRLTFDFDLAAEHVGGALDVLRAHLEAGAGN